MGSGWGGSLVGPECPVWLALRGGLACHGERHRLPWLPGVTLVGSRVPSPAPAWGEGAVLVMLYGPGTHPEPPYSPASCHRTNTFLEATPASPGAGRHSQGSGVPAPCRWHRRAVGTDSSSAPPLNMGEVWQRQGVSVPALRDAGGSAPKQHRGRTGPHRTRLCPPTGSLLGHCLYEQGRSCRAARQWADTAAVPGRALASSTSKSKVHL